MLELRVSSSVYNAVVPIERRITYIRGDSGTGKTSLVNTLIEYSNDVQGIDVVFPLKINVMQSVPEYNVLKAYRDCMLVFDDTISTERDMSVFNKLCYTNNLYLVVINRVDPIEIKRDKPNKDDKSNKLKFSVSSILVCIKDGINHYFKPFCNSGTFNEDWYSERVSYILTEDSYGLMNMSEILGVPCITSKGNRNIVKCLKDMIGSGKDNILVCADWSSYGGYFSDFYEMFKDSDKNIFLDFNYECFEYMLLMSNMLSNEFKFDIEKANSYESWENYFEHELEKLTKHTHYAYSHGKEVKGCYTKECRSNTDYCNKYIYNKCKKACDGKKIDYLFKDTIFDYMRTLQESQLIR